MPARKSSRPPQQEFTISSGMIKWIVSIAGALIALIVGYWQIADRVDSHWRLEQVQKAHDDAQAARDQKVDAAIADARIKAETDTHAMAKKAEVGRAWVQWTVLDTKAYSAGQFARFCRALKLPADQCAQMDSDAAAFRQEASDAKRSASDAGKQ